MATLAPSQVTNPSFEDPGGPAGVAFGWTLTTFASYEELAFFSALDVDGTIEDFADWVPGALSGFAETDVTKAVFDAITLLAEPYEDFEEYWSDNHHALPSLLNASMAVADFDGDVETFDWSDLLEELSELSSASFSDDDGGTGTVEPFDDGWHNGIHWYVWAHTPLYLTTAIFDAAPPTLYEDFEDEWSLTLTGL